MSNGAGPLKRPKYNAKQVWLTEPGTIIKKEQLGGIVPQGAIPFDSAIEAQYYRDVLLPQEIIGLIQVIRQPRYEIVKSFESDGVTYKSTFYVADFAVTYQDGRTEAIDVKGVITDVFALKRRLFMIAFPNTKLRVIKFVKKYGGWVTIEEYAANKKQERKRSR